MKRILAMLLSVICVLSFTCVSTYADEKSEDEEKAASIAESYLSAAAKNMWLYESNNLAEHTIQELVDTSGNSLLSDMSTDVNTQKILSSMDNITFVQEKSKYFREMRQRQDIQRNDFALEYAVTSASIEDNVATLSIIEHISFHYSTFPDTLSELVNYYDVDLIKCNGSWYVSDVTSTNDDFDAIYKGSEFTAEKADEIIALRDAHSLNDTSAIEAIMDDYNLSDNSNATLAGSTTWYNYNATMEMSRNVQSGNTQNLKSTVIQRSFPKWSVAERRKTAAASDQAAVCACTHSRYFAGGSPIGLRV